MSNDLHQKATRFVAFALVPAVVAIVGVAAWGLQPPPVVGSDALRTSAWTLVVPDRARPPSPDVIVGAVTAVSRPATIIPATRAAAATTAATAKPKTRHCEEFAMYNSGHEKVWICEWL